MISGRDVVNTGPGESDPAPASVEVGTAAHDNFMGRVCINRHHKKRVCIVFVDGHDEPVTPKDRWTSRWHRNRVTPEPTPDP